MISSKTAAILLLIILNMQLVTSTSSDIQESSSSEMSALRTRRHKPVSNTKESVLADTTSKMEDAEVQEDDTRTVNTSRGQLAPRIYDFEKLINRGRYEEIIKLGRRISRLYFLKQICPFIKNIEQYNGIVDHLNSRDLVTPFYVQGDIRVVKEAIIVESRIYEGDSDYVKRGDLKDALLLALKESYHDRVIELLNIGKEIATEEDGQYMQNGKPTGFEWLLLGFFDDLAPWKDGTVLKRFLTHRGNELRSKHPDIFDALCQWLMYNLKYQLDTPYAEKLLVDLIGQPSLLTPVSFVKAFWTVRESSHSNPCKYAWREAMEEGSKEEHSIGGRRIWQMAKRMYPDQLPEEFPVTEEERAVVCKYFPTKQQLEIQWIRDNAPGFLEKFDELVKEDIFPKVIAEIVFEYARPTWLDIEVYNPRSIWGDMDWESSEVSLYGLGLLWCYALLYLVSLLTKTFTM